MIWLVKRGAFSSLPAYLSLTHLNRQATVAHWTIAGFFMWCIFVVGHDCGHGNFSEYVL